MDLNSFVVQVNALLAKLELHCLGLVYHPERLNGYDFDCGFWFLVQYMCGINEARSEDGESIVCCGTML